MPPPRQQQQQQLGSQGTYVTRRTRKEPLFVILIICVVTIFSIFVLAAVKVTREIRAEILVFWAILFTAALAVLSLLYLTVLIAYYTQLPENGSTFIHFCLGVAWAIALVAESLDPNNTWPSKLREVERNGKHGESMVNFKARIALTGITAFLLLAMSLVGGLRVLGINFHDWREQDRWTGQAASVELAGRSRVVYTPSRATSQTQVPSAPKSPIMVILERVGIMKDRSSTNERAVAA
ncbi:hypothetical protein BDD12DRAFT_804839 [Trichophaea hybrida]|nr:hypothetical protein BDD12DRAFT_804839 [Trichophaea hybrida]